MALIFYMLAGVTLISAMMVVTRPNAVHSALWLILTFFGVAGLFILQRAEFIAAVQVFVYAGGIMVLFLFVIMLVNLERVEGSVRSRRRTVAACILVALMVVALGTVVALSEGADGVPVADGGLPSVLALDTEVLGNLETVGMVLMTNYLLAFELVSVLLLVAIVGAIVLCRRAA